MARPGGKEVREAREVEGGRREEEVRERVREGGRREGVR